MTDEAAFAEFYRSNYRGVVAQLYAYTGDLTEAQESAQEAFIRAWTRWQKVAEYDEPRAWVCRVAYRVAVSRWRRARTAAASWRRHGPPNPGPEPDGVSADLVAALRQLPEAQRRALVLHYLGGFSVAEIASLDGVASGTVRSRLSRGRDALAEVMGSTDGYGVARRGPGQPDRAPPDRPDATRWEVCASA
jgi:RNA polymerase sigma-70 factor (ECF subfamily)